MKKKINPFKNSIMKTKEVNKKIKISSTVLFLSTKQSDSVYLRGYLSV